MDTLYIGDNFSTSSYPYYFNFITPPELNGLSVWIRNSIGNVSFDETCYDPITICKFKTSDLTQTIIEYSANS